jgi:inner membrane protein involved in colicin E2 resistance
MSKTRQRALYMRDYRAKRIQAAVAAQAVIAAQEATNSEQEEGTGRDEVEGVSTEMATEATCDARAADKKRKRALYMREYRAKRKLTASASRSSHVEEEEEEVHRQFNEVRTELATEEKEGTGRDEVEGVSTEMAADKKLKRSLYMREYRAKRKLTVSASQDKTSSHVEEEDEEVHQKVEHGDDVHTELAAEEKCDGSAGDRNRKRALYKRDYCAKRK